MSSAKPGIKNLKAKLLQARNWHRNRNRTARQFSESAGDCLHALENLGLAQGVIARFGATVDPFNQIVGHRIATPFEPEMDVRLAAHRTDVDYLLHAKNV